MLKTFAAAAALAMAATTASAFTIGPGNLSSGGTYDIANGPYMFNVSFLDSSDGPGVFNFNFTSKTTTTVTATVASVLQQGLSFVGGVTVGWEDGEVASFDGSGAGDILTVDHTIAAGETDTLYIDYGDVVGRSGRAHISLMVNSVAAVPVPAAGLMLVGALGGLAALRRRKA